MNKTQKTPTGLNCLTVSSEEFVAVDDSNVSTTPIMADKDILEFNKRSKNNIDVDSDFNDYDTFIDGLIVYAIEDEEIVDPSYPMNNHSNVEIDDETNIKHTKTMTPIKGLSLDEISNLLRDLSENESGGGELSCSNLDSNEEIRMSKSNCEESEE
ncbi:hypothetical protein TNCV_4074721 [Trichonephila clavipes]|nr:hypothetical protein TNCV_4074721 [Trichonephila clavipes]